MSVSGNPVAMYTPSNGQAHIFYRGDGDSRQGFVIEHVFWGEEYYNQPYVPKSEQWVGPNATYTLSRVGGSMDWIWDPIDFLKTTPCKVAELSALKRRRQRQKPYFAWCCSSKLL